jgi:putative transposase
MSDTTVIPLRHPDTIEDPLTAVLRSGARRLLAQAIELHPVSLDSHLSDRRPA